MSYCNQVTFASIAMAFLVSACVPIPIVIPPGKLQPVRDWPTESKCPVPARSTTDGPRLVELMNGERAKAGLAPLVLSPEISAVAHAFACESAARGDIGHVGIDGSKLSERLMRGGLAPLNVAENNAGIYDTAEEVLAAWMASPHHRENILRPNMRAVGVGQADGAYPIWVADFTS
ncbi:MAG: CAP domain-containing protein [Candidatus Saccharibacteria bacterium]|nr:CAP domain-containing protein [Pseudorhodobacter sp.]